MQKLVTFVEKNLKINMLKIKKYRKVRHHCQYPEKYRGAAYSICNLKYSVPTEISIVFHNGFNYDYHFTTKKVAEEFEGRLTCLGKNAEKCITFTVPIEKEGKGIDKNWKKITNTISYISQFIDSARFMVSALSNRVSNLPERIHKIKYKFGYYDKKCKTYEIKYKD